MAIRRTHSKAETQNNKHRIGLKFYSAVRNVWITKPDSPVDSLVEEKGAEGGMDNLCFEFPAEVPWFSQFAPLQGTLGREGVATKASADTLGSISKTSYRHWVQV